MVFLGQLHMFFQYKPVSNFLEGLLFTQTESYVYSVYFFVDVFFGYMTFISCYSLFSIKISGFYGFYSRQTDPITFLTFVYYMSKLTYPLCYTTLNILLGNTEAITRTSFHQTIGNLTVVPILGYDVPAYLPILFSLLLVLFFTDCFTHMLRVLGFNFYSFDEKAECSQTEEGKRIATEYANLFYEELIEKEEEQKKKKGILTNDNLFGSVLLGMEKSDTGSRATHEANKGNELAIGIPEHNPDERLL